MFCFFVLTDIQVSLRRQLQSVNTLVDVSFLSDARHTGACRDPFHYYVKRPLEAMLEV